MIQRSGAVVIPSEQSESRDLPQVIDCLRIRDVVQNWALWRDAGDWERFRTVWHPEARMMATWSISWKT